MAKEPKKEVQEEIILNPFGTTFEIEVDNYKGVKKCVIAYPDRKTFYSILSKVMNSKDEAETEYEVGERLIEGMVSGDQEFLTDDIYMVLGYAKAVQEFQKRSTFLKKN